MTISDLPPAANGDSLLPSGQMNISDVPPATIGPGWHPSGQRTTTPQELRAWNAQAHHTAGPKNAGNLPGAGNPLLGAAGQAVAPDVSLSGLKYAQAQAQAFGKMARGAGAIARNAKRGQQNEPKTRDPGTTNQEIEKEGRVRRGTAMRIRPIDN
jgi:hypothetical protein